MGSKSRIAKHIVPIIQEQIDKNNVQGYIEPFCGGANVIDKINCNTKIGFDINPYLIALLNRVKEGGELYDEVSKELYDQARAAYNSGDTSEFEDWQIGNIGFLASFNGRFFSGGYAKSGYEKTKNGKKYRDYYQESKRNLLNQSESLKDIVFNCQDYRKTIFLKNGYVVYCDPPYQNTKKFEYSQNFDYEEFWNIMREWSKKNIVIISELQAPDDFDCIWEKEVSRSIKATDKSRATEKLFRWKG